MPDSIFTKIIRGDIPCHKVYEDAQVFAFLDVSPLSPGHTLVVPKEEKATLAELSDESAGAIGRVLPRICRAVMSATGCDAYNILQNNGAEAHQAVMHVHFHIIPKPSASTGLGISWPTTKLDQAHGAALAASIAKVMNTPD
ncbi:MAG: HIT family protein [Phycisphaerales bacterium]|nr:HIT family protein [Phycisphaerales bacterium]